eukprot:403374594
MKEWLSKQKLEKHNKTVKFKLLYKAKRDGFSANNFHKFCDNQGPTVCLILSQFDRIFGGYTSLSWQSPLKGTYQKDLQAFIFSLNYQTRHALFQNKEKAVYHKKGAHIQFSFDIAIADENCDKSGSTSGCNLGYSYRLPKNISQGSDDAKSYLGGAYSFKVQDIEVYQVMYS